MDRFGGNKFGRRDNFGGGASRGERSFAPVKVGDELDVRIEAVGGKGDGIAKKNGFVLFVPGVKEGDEVKIRVTKVLKKVGFAEVAGSVTKKEESQEAEEAPKEEEEDYSGEDSEDFGESDDSGDDSGEEDSGDEDSGDEDSGDENFDEGEEEEKLKKFTEEEQ